MSKALIYMVHDIRVSDFLHLFCFSPSISHILFFFFLIFHLDYLCKHHLLVHNLLNHECFTINRISWLAVRASVITFFSLLFSLAQVVVLLSSFLLLLYLHTQRTSIDGYITWITTFTTISFFVVNDLRRFSIGKYSPIFLLQKFSISFFDSESNETRKHDLV